MRLSQSLACLAVVAASFAPAAQADPFDQLLPDSTALYVSMRAFLDAFDIDVDWDTLSQVPDESLVRSLAMMCPFEPREKQALLECATLAERSELVTSLIEMTVLQRPGTASMAQ